MLGRSYSSTAYKYGFNGQEKDDEVAGSGNINTAMFWEYDTRIGRRWNIDPIPFVGISPYSVFTNNPIVNIDREGNTTYVYNQQGILKDVILDKLNANEIVFLTDKMIVAVNRYPNFISDEHKALTVRDNRVNFAKIKGSTVEKFTSTWTNSKAENGGMLVINPETHELQPSPCKDCGVENTNMGGELNVDKLIKHSSSLSRIIKQVGYYHTHPNDRFNPIAHTQPSSGKGQDLDVGLALKALSGGGIGIIVNPNSITIFPLNTTNINYSDVNLNNNKTGMFNKQYMITIPKEGLQGGTSGVETKKYPSYDKKVRPVR